MTLLFDRKRHDKPTAALLRSRMGAKVRWQKHDHTIRGYTFEGRMGSGFLSEVKGRNVCIGGDWLWLPDLARLWVLDQDESDEVKSP